jgi:ribosomal protein S18 acetylase RimI-like enzyme
MQPIKLRFIQDLQELAELFDQRWRVLRSPLGMAHGTEQDAYEQASLHLIAVHHDPIALDANCPIVGSARLRQLSSDIGSIAYVAVLPEFQHQGIGTALIQCLVKIAQMKNLKQVRLMARTSTVGFYQRLGFLEAGEPFDYLGIPHVFMLLNVPTADAVEASPISLDGDMNLNVGTAFPHSDSSGDRSEVT